MLMSFLNRSGIRVFESADPDAEENYFHRIMDDAER